MLLLLIESIFICCATSLVTYSTALTNEKTFQNSSVGHVVESVNQAINSSDDANSTLYWSDSPLSQHSSTLDEVEISSNHTEQPQSQINEEVSVESTASLFNSSDTLLEFNVTKENGTTEEEYLKSDYSNSVFNVGVIAGISALVIIIAVLIGVIAFVLYRHFSWNRPLTLGDKFSNDESTGYIDDTAFRENSEEMYSLDNDSFLNSLEAMTIQNYWTDRVKHTKL